MADTATLTSFPLPPQQFVCKYTDENVKNGRAPKPPLPPKDAYMMFGGEYRPDDVIIRPLEAQNILRLHPHNYDHRRELKKLNFSIVANFIDLIQLLVQSPDSPRRMEKVDDLTLLFIHMHHLINEFRPHQARESLRVMMELQKRNRLEVVAKFQDCLSQVVELLNSTIAALPSASQVDSKLLIDKRHVSSYATTAAPAAAPAGNQLIINNNVNNNNGGGGGLNEEDSKEGVLLLGDSWWHKGGDDDKKMDGGDDSDAKGKGGGDDDDADEMMCNIVDALN